MEIFNIYDSKGNLKAEQDMFMFYSPCGVLYYGDITTGRIKWGHDLKKMAYQAMRHTDDEPYADVGQDGNTLHHYSSNSVSQRVILGDSEQVLKLNLKNIFGKDARVKRNESVLYLTCNSGVETSEDDKNSFKILMTEWRVSIDDSWSVRFVNVDAFSRCADDSLMEMSSLFHARTIDKFIGLCDRFDVYEIPGDGNLASIVNCRRRIRVLDRINTKGQVAYFNGTIGKNEVFVKRIPIQAEDLKNKLEDVYARSNCGEAVVKLILVEKHGNFFYLAFEKFRYSLAYLIKNHPENAQLDKLRILRGIVKALQNLHSDSTFHCNICPEHILVNLEPGRDVVIKFCGMGSSTRLSVVTDFVESKLHNTEKRMLGKSFLNFMTRGAYSFKEGDELPRYNTPTNAIPRLDLSELDVVSADLIEKLVYNTSITLKLVLSHVIFWNVTQTMYFLECLSLQKFAFHHYKDIDVTVCEVFKDNWILPDSKAFRVWFQEMTIAPVDKRYYGFPKPATEAWADITDQEIKSEYDTTRVSDLVKLSRNTTQHPFDMYPARSKVELHGFLNTNYPKLVMELYNYTLRKNNPPLAEWFDLGMI